MKNNILVAYRGGGYDGCFWEWNFFSFDKNGKFHNLFTSGRNGIKDEAGAERIIEEADSNTFVYDLTDDVKVREFQENHAVPHVAGVIDALNNGKNGDYTKDIYCTCHECGEKLYTKDEMRIEGWHGCGGIASTADELYCEDCYNSKCCSECGEFYGDELEDGMCTDCAHELVKANLIEEGYVLLEYDKMKNAFYEVEGEGEYCIDDFKLSRTWAIIAETKEALRKFIVDADTIELAIDYVDSYLGRENILSLKQFSYVSEAMQG